MWPAFDLNAYFDWLLKTIAGRTDFCLACLPTCHHGRCCYCCRLLDSCPLSADRQLGLKRWGASERSLPPPPRYAQPRLRQAAPGSL
eukprot:3512708-Heterocapsa_arctica.AAC.1